MPEYIIKWDAGNGEEYDIVDAEDENDAMNYAYMQWPEAIAEKYGVVGEVTDELLDEYGL